MLEIYRLERIYDPVHGSLPPHPEYSTSFGLHFGREISVHLGRAISVHFGLAISLQRSHVGRLQPHGTCITFLILILLAKRATAKKKHTTITGINITTHATFS